jgi:hypothetical protein
MKDQMIVIILAIPITVLVLIAAGAGLFWQWSGEPYDHRSARGDKALIQGHGLYRYDTVSGGAQEQGNDFFTLAVGIPPLVAGLALSHRGSMRTGQLRAGNESNTALVIRVLDLGIIR